jgi:putative transposase
VVWARAPVLSVVVQASRLHLTDLWSSCLVCLIDLWCSRLGCSGMQAGRLHHKGRCTSGRWLAQSIMDFIDPRSTPFVPIRCRGELPHLYKENGSHFVTFRQFDAVTRSSRRIDRRALRGLQTEEIMRCCEPPLRLGSCVLTRPEIAKVIRDAMEHFDGQRYLLAAWCIMPNHVHAVFAAMDEHTPQDILHSWKSFTSHEINKILGRIGTFWERESFDHLIRSIEGFEEVVRYIENSPVTAGLCASPEHWPYGSCGV